MPNTNRVAIYSVFTVLLVAAFTNRVRSSLLGRLLCGVVSHLIACIGGGGAHEKTGFTHGLHEVGVEVAGALVLVAARIIMKPRSGLSVSIEWLHRVWGRRCSPSAAHWNGVDITPFARLVGTSLHIGTECQAHEYRGGWVHSPAPH